MVWNLLWHGKPGLLEEQNRHWNSTFQNKWNLTNQNRAKTKAIKAQGPGFQFLGLFVIFAYHPTFIGTARYKFKPPTQTGAMEQVLTNFGHNSLFKSFAPAEPKSLVGTQMRNNSIDKLKGIAVLIMVSANLSPNFTSLNNLYIRLLFSLAAPFFLFASGTLNKKTNFQGGLMRSLALLVWAVLNDYFIFNVKPFQTFDILYVMALSGLAIVFLNRFSETTNRILVFSGILLYYLALRFLKYNFEISDNYSYSENLAEILDRLLISGWFPIFPWIFLPMLARFFPYQLLKTGVWLLLTFVLLPVNFALPVMPLRNGYFELFYPLTFPLLAFAFCCFSLLCSLASNLKQSVLDVIGSYSLMVYLVSNFIIKLYPLLCPACIGLGYLFTSVLVTLVSLGVSLLLLKTVGRWPLVKKYYFTKMLFNGIKI